MKEIIIDIAGYILLGAIAVVVLYVIGDAFIRFVWNKWLKKLISNPIHNFIYCIRVRYFLPIEDIIKLNKLYKEIKFSRLKQGKTFNGRLFRKILVKRLRKHHKEQICNKVKIN